MINNKSLKAKRFLNGIRVISFDAGFTLIYTEPAVGNVYARIASRFGYQLNGEEIHSRFKAIWKSKSSRNPLEKMNSLADEEDAYQWWKGIFAGAVGTDVKPGDIDDIFNVCFHEYARGDYWRLYPEVLHTLTVLRAQGFRLVVLSNWDRRLLQTLKDLQLDVFFEKIFISTLIGYAKPDPRAFASVVDDLIVSPQEILHVGDTVHEDIQGAIQAKIQAVCLDRTGKNCAVPGQVPVITSLSELLE